MPQLYHETSIPYAEAPVSSLRFVPPVAWSKQYPGGARDATKQGAQCISDSQKSGNEDCLFLVSEDGLCPSLC